MRPSLRKGETAEVAEVEEVEEVEVEEGKAVGSVTAGSFLRIG